ncbi:MAG: hypothetical protein BZY88_02195 [SAR202 cluster bacterium Io17-Chloro-G9]|nr:MAG: hypothetical protein BZY88_02195 [SAR202 cluster bacterium Io17-Chloro-G9]
MEIFATLFGTLIQFLVIGGIIAAVVVFLRRRGESEADQGIGTLRRLYYYGLSFVALMFSASGAVLLVDYVADSFSGKQLLSRGETQLALALAITIVGTPIWLFHWWLAYRAVRRFPSETRALSRKVYLSLVLGVSAALGAFGLVSLLRWLLGADDFNGLHLAFPLVWGGVWGFHWYVDSQEAAMTEAGHSVRRLYVYATALYGLVMLLVGLGLILRRLLWQVYDGIFATRVLLPGEGDLWNGATQTSLALFLASGLIWWWHWHRVSRDDLDSALRQVYLHFFAILGGALTVAATLSIILFKMLQWAFGEPDAAGAAEHFEFLPAALAALISGGALWGYHWAVVRQESATGVVGLAAAVHTYRYLLAALGLGTLAAGMIILFGVVIGVIAPQSGQELLRTDWWRNPLASAATLMLVGAPLWGYYWFGVQRDAGAGLLDRIALPRRIFIYLVLGAAILGVLGNLSALLFIFLRDLLEGDLSAQTVQDAKWSIGVLLTAGAVSVYHWLVLREDRGTIPETGRATIPALPVGKAVIALASEAAQPLLLRMEAQLGVPVRLWRRLDSDDQVPTLSDEELAATRERIAHAPGDRVLLTIDASGMRVVPYREV